MQRIYTFSILFLSFLVFSFSASAKMSDVSDKAAETQNIATYLDGLETLKSRFVQTAPDGSQLVGTFYLSRPGKLRFEYDAPIEDFVVADGHFIYFYDSELQQQTNAPIGQTMADFLLRGDISFDGDVAVQNLKRGGGYLQIELAQAADPDAGRLMLALQENPLRLKKWRIVDPQGLITEVELFYAQENVQLEDALFYYIDPNKGQERYNK